jgi:hypothetical protein
MAFAVLYVCYTTCMLWVGGRLSEFRWSGAVTRLLGEACAAAAGTFLLARFAPSVVSTTVGAAVVVVTGLVCLQRICLRLGKEHRVTLWVARLPGVGRWLPDSGTCRIQR